MILELCNFLLFLVANRLPLVANRLPLDIKKAKNTTAATKAAKEKADQRAEVVVKVADTAEVVKRKAKEETSKIKAT